MKRINRQLDFVIVTITDEVGWESEAIQNIASQSYLKSGNRKFHWYIVSTDINHKIQAFQQLCGDGKAQRITTMTVDGRLTFRNAMQAVIAKTKPWIYTIVNYDVREELGNDALRGLLSNRKSKFNGGVSYANKDVDIMGTAAFSRAFLVKACKNSADDNELVKLIKQYKYLHAGIL